MRKPSLVLLSTLAGCSLLPGAQVSRPEPTLAPPGMSNAEASAGPPAGAAASPAAGGDAFCPADIPVDVGHARTIDTRRGPNMDPKVWHHMKWAAEHEKPLTAKFFRPSSVAIDAVLAVEQKNPKVIPPPFRAALAAHPRDAALRLRVAGCEAGQPATRRRAAYDGALALLLGAPAADASAMVERGTWGESHSKSTSFCSAKESSCDAGSYCDPEREECITRAEHVHSYISPDELAIEDALTHVLLRRAVLGDGPALDKSAADGWMMFTVYKCGKQLCKATLYGNNDSDAKIVAMDRRDGGTVEEVPLSKADLRARAQCQRSIGFPSRSACETDCWERYGIHGSEYWDAENACKAECGHGCDH